MEKALEIYREALGQHGCYPELLEAIADIHSAKKDYNRANEVNFGLQLKNMIFLYYLIYNNHLSKF